MCAVRSLRGHDENVASVTVMTSVLAKNKAHAPDNIRTIVLSLAPPWTSRSLYHRCSLMCITGSHCIEPYCGRTNCKS